MAVLKGYSGRERCEGVRVSVDERLTLGPDSVSSVDMND